MHLVLSGFHFVTWFGDSPDSLASYRSLQLLAVLLETLNLCMMLQLFATSIVSGLKITPEATKFQIWVLCEIFVALSTILASMFYLLLRSYFNWNKFTFNEDDET